MKTAIKVLLIVAASLAVAGIGLFVAALAIGGWSFSAFKTEYEAVTYDVPQPFSSIAIDVNEHDVTFRPATDGKCRVVADEGEKVTHAVTVKDGTLSIAVEDGRKWYERWTFFAFESPKMTVYLPEKEYDALTVESSTGDVTLPADFTFDSVDVTLSTGDITVDGASVGALSLSVSTGRTTVSDLTCRTFTSEGGTGDLTLKNVLVDGKMSIKRGTGDVDLQRCDAAELSIKTSTGDVTGTLRTPKIFFADTSTGRVSVPQTTTGGRCEIKTSTGDIEITIAK